MEIENFESDSASLAPLVAKAMGNVIRFKEIRPSWRVAPDGNPAWVIPAYKYTDGVQPNLSIAIPPVVVSEEFVLPPVWCSRVKVHRCRIIHMKN